MAKKGFKIISSDPFAYIELDSGLASVAMGLDDNTNSFKIKSLATVGALPTATAQIEIDPAANGNITMTPNGSGKMVLSGVASVATASPEIVTINSVTGQLGATDTPTVTSITILNAPVAGTDGVNKAYADAIAAGVSYLTPSVAATTANLNATYANGAAGVGATLTNAGTQVAFAVDGYSASLNDRILVKDQTTQANNGIYTVTTVGSGATNWVLTRATDYDTAVEIHSGTVVPVTAGATQANTSWLQTQNVVTVGTNPIIFVQFTFDTNAFLQKANNLSDVASASSSRTNLGLTNVAIQTVTNHSVLVGAASDGITSIANGTTGQVLHAVTGANDPVWAQVNLATDVTGVLPAANGGAPVWSVITADQTAAVGNGYICNKAGLLTLTLPATGAIGDIIIVTGINTALGWKIAQNANQRIHFGDLSSTVGVGGSLASTLTRDTVEIVCVVAGASTEWNVIYSIGNITVV